MNSVAPSSSAAVKTAPVRLALYSVLRADSTATLIPDVTDPQGRHGVGIQFGDAWKTTVVFDPQRGSVLASHSTGPGHDDWIITLESTRTDTAPR